MSCPARRRSAAGRLVVRVLALVCAVLVPGAVAVPAAFAADGTFTQILCADPDTGRGVVGGDGSSRPVVRVLRSDMHAVRLGPSATPAARG
jgi:hypothetical protein